MRKALAQPPGFGDFYEGALPLTCSAKDALSAARRLSVHRSLGGFRLLAKVVMPKLDATLGPFRV